MVLLDADPQILLFLIFAQAFADQRLGKDVRLSSQKAEHPHYAWFPRNLISLTS